MVNTKSIIVGASVLGMLIGTLAAQASDFHASSRIAVPGPLALRAPASEAPHSAPAQLKVTRAKVFEAGSRHSKLVFTMVREEKRDGDRSVVTETFTDPQGVEALRSVTELRGEKFVSYSLEQKQLGESAKIEARGEKLFFEYTDKNGKTKKGDEDLHENFVLSPIMGRFVRAHWEDLASGKTLEMRFGVPERRETVGFKIFKEDETNIDGRDVIVAKMKPTSIIIAALVKPLYFYYDKATGKLLEFRGRVLPKRKDGSSWKDLDAESVYEE